MSNEIQKLKAGGVFHFDVIRDGKIVDSFEEHNIVVDTGLNYILDAALSNGSQLTTFYVSLFKNNRSVQSTDTMSNFASLAGEISTPTDVDETIRETWTEAGVSAKSITNTATPAEYNFASDTDVWGAFLVAGSNVIGGTSGTLIAGAKFNAIRSMLAGDVLTVTYTFNIADA